MVDAMAGGDLVAAGGQIREYGALVEGADARRRLGVADAILLAHGGRFQSAAEALLGIAAGIADEAERDGMIALAAHFAVGAGVEPQPREAMPLSATPGDLDATLTVAPNPVQQRGRVHLAFGQPGRVRLSIRDVLGREVGVITETNVAAGPAAFDLPALPAGVYMVEALIVAGNSTPRTVARRFTVVR